MTTWVDGAAPTRRRPCRAIRAVRGAVPTRAAATASSLDTLLRAEVLTPTGLTATTSADTAVLPPPVQHRRSAELRAFLQILAGTPFVEDST